MSEMNVFRVEARARQANLRENRVARDARRYFNIPLYGAEELQVFWLLGCTRQDALLWAREVLSDPILQTVAIDSDEMSLERENERVPSFAVEVRFRPGVTDNVGKSAAEAVRIHSPGERSAAMLLIISPREPIASLNFL